MDLLQLRYFWETSKNENFSTTAKKFSVPPSSVSASIKRLESELMHPLFDRSSNKIKLNHYGKALALAVEESITKLDNAVSLIKNSNKERVYIKILVKARSKWITDLIVEFRSTHPNIFFYITNDSEVTTFDDFDIIIDEENDYYYNRDKFLISIEKICIKAEKNSPLVGRTLSIKDISEQPFVLMGKGNAMRRLIERIGKENDFLPNISIECTDRQCIFNCVENGMGLTIGSVHALQSEDQKNLAALNVKDFNEQQRVYVYYLKTKPLSDELKEFLKFLNIKKRV